ncbi:transcription initiation factor IIF subunit alpha-like [Rosa rugosa]|uniref:transcription initiation factor IIF subunit alpha-like n=1 Tax=Rosa rugosa TaxID=74645 RepID=UPI002B4082CF|nr:transcription initiation factor IIF subunit alpha-like [Rosa rugosa]
MYRLQFYEHFVVPFMQDDDEDYNNDEDGRLSKSGNELKKLLGRLNKSDTEDDDDADNDNADGDDDMDDVIDKGPLKAVPSGTSQQPHLPPREREKGKKPSVKEEPASASPVTEEEIRAVLMQQLPITEKEVFTAILKRMHSQKTISRKPKDNGTRYFVVLRESELYMAFP